MSFWKTVVTWFTSTFDYNKDGVVDKEDVEMKVEAVKKETKRRVRRVKEELDDVKSAAKDVVDQAKDVAGAVKGKPRRGRKPRATTKKK